MTIIKTHNICFILLVSLVLSFRVAHAAERRIITDYRAIFTAGYNDQQQLRIAIRAYYADNIPYYLVVNPYKLTTKALPAAEFNAISASRQTDAIQNQLASTPYMQALSNYSNPPYPLSNDGMTHAETKVNGYFLTVDMCQSKKPFEKTFFEKLVAIADETKKPFPVAISMTGLWMQKHPYEFKWLLAQQQAGKLDITWTNHSFTHPYIPGVNRIRIFY